MDLASNLVCDVAGVVQSQPIADLVRGALDDFESRSVVAAVVDSAALVQADAQVSQDIVHPAGNDNYGMVQRVVTDILEDENGVDTAVGAVAVFEPEANCHVMDKTGCMIDLENTVQENCAAMYIPL